VSSTMISIGERSMAAIVSLNLAALMGQQSSRKCI
jgi:hypothetical protein